jgi:hypothetical protein
MLYLSNKGNIRLIANFLTSRIASLCNRSDGLIRNPDSSDAANLSVPSELNVICILLLTLSTAFTMGSFNSDIKIQLLLQVQYRAYDIMCYYGIYIYRIYDISSKEIIAS